MKTKFFPLLFSVCFVCLQAQAKEPSKPWEQWASANPAWVEPVAPFKIIDNIYYVGTRGIGSYLIASDNGHVLLDGGMPQNAVLIANSVKQLGFKLSDVKLLLNSHAHFDHSGGLAELKLLSGASLLASEPDREALETGLYAGSDDVDYSAPPVMVDRVIKDGDVIQLGELALSPILMPGHSPGCTFWSTSVTEQGKTYKVLFFGSASVAGNRLLSPPQYPGIVDDYRKTFERAKSLKPDVLLANHPEFSKLWQQRQRQIDSGSALAFVDPEVFPALMKKLEADFEKALKRQTAEGQEDTSP